MSHYIRLAFWDHYSYFWVCWAKFCVADKIAGFMDIWEQGDSDIVKKFVFWLGFDWQYMCHFIKKHQIFYFILNVHLENTFYMDPIFLIWKGCISSNVLQITWNTLQHGWIRKNEVPLYWFNMENSEIWL